MKPDFDKGVHVREGFCCLGEQWSCGHTRTCMYDKQWAIAHDKIHRFDNLPFMFLGITCYIAFIVWIVTK